MHRRTLLSGLGSMTALSACGSALPDLLQERDVMAQSNYPPTGKIISVDGKDVHVDIRGSGPDLVLIHGASGSSRDFTFAFADRMAKHFRVTSMDRPGLGWSTSLGDEGVSPLFQAQHLQKAARKAGIRSPIVMGHSYGGSVAMAWALLDPAGTKGVMSLSGATVSWDGGIGVWYGVLGSTIGQASIIPLISAYTDRARAERVLEDIFAPNEMPKGYADYIGLDVTLKESVFRENARQVHNLNAQLALMEKGYPKLTMPVSVVFGDQDTIVPAEVQGLGLLRKIPTADFRLIPGAGHVPHHSHPDVVEAELLKLARRANP